MHYGLVKIAQNSSVINRRQIRVEMVLIVSHCTTTTIISVCVMVCTVESIVKSATLTVQVRHVRHMGNVQMILPIHLGIGVTVMQDLLALTVK